MAHYGFDAETHTYYLTPADTEPRVVPSVTQVLEHVGMAPDLDHLPRYYMDRGRAIHRAVGLELYGRLDWSTLDERIEPFVRRAREFLELLEITPLVIEFRWVCRVHGYGGTLDLFAESNLGPVLIDWKATTHDQSYAVQVAGGYLPLLEQAAEEGAVPVAPGDVKKARLAVVTLGTDIPKPHWITKDNNREIFRAALAVSQWRKQLGR
jgi:hypothetical protein